jgi:hypothetical protein
MSSEPIVGYAKQHLDKSISTLTKKQDKIKADIARLEKDSNLHLFVGSVASKDLKSYMERHFEMQRTALQKKRELEEKTGKELDEMRALRERVH